MLVWYKGNMALIRNLEADDVKELQEMKKRGEISITPTQEEELFQKGQQAVDLLSQPTTSLTAEQKQQYLDLATAIGAFGMVGNSSRLASLAVKMQNLLE